MPFQHSTSVGWRLLASSTLVGSLALDHQNIWADRVAPKQRRRRADATNNPTASKNLDSEKKIIISKPDGIDREAQGKR